MNVKIPEPNERQKLFLKENRHKYIGFGGARGGGKSWAVRMKSFLLCMRYPGIKCLIVRRTYPELINNHVNEFTKFFTANGLMPLYVKYNDKDKVFKFANGSSINFTYCQRDKDLNRLQGTEWDCIFLDEATQLSEFQCKSITATLRGVNDFPKRVYYTCNPGGQSHGYFKRIFIDKVYRDGEDGNDYVFIQSRVTDNKALMKENPDYIKQLEALPPKMREMWLYGNWDIFEGMFFEDFQPNPTGKEASETGLDIDELKKAHRYCHVIDPIPITGMNIYRSYDFGYNKPFSCGWWAVDKDGVIYRIHEYYGWNKTPNEGLKIPPEQQFRNIAQIENTHPLLKGKKIEGVADPSIWDTSRGESIAETAERHGIYFEKGDNHRIAGWMQCHYRLQFDENGYPMMYVFSTCEQFIRTIPTLMYSDTNPEDLNTELEDHIADEWRYFCMTRPIKPRIKETPVIPKDDPLELFGDYGRGMTYASREIR